MPKYSDEIALLKYIHEHPSISTIRGNPAAVNAAMEEFALNTNKIFMTLEPEKRDHIIKILASAAGLSANTPKVFLEFGAYIGYPAIALGAALRELNPGQKVSYFSFEKNPLMAAITSSLVELAGLKDVVHVNVGPASDSVVRLVAEGKLEKGSIDFMLLDHWKDVYVSDLQLCEELSLLHEDSVVIADNVLYPGAPEYLAYVKKGVAERSAEGFRYETKTTDFIMPNGKPVSSYFLT